MKCFGGILILTIMIYVVQAQTPLSVHVIDANNGGNAAGVRVRAYVQDGDDFNFLSEDYTDSNGRVNALVSANDYTSGVYRIELDSKTYYNSNGITTFWPAIFNTFNVLNTAVDHHIPFVLSPFSVFTYRGS